MDKFVYHSSTISGLKFLEPHVSTHEKNYVYAATIRELSLAFLSGIGGDFTCQLHVEHNIVHIVERFEGAFKHRYEDKSGSIYTLLSDNFLSDKTGWPYEVVSESKVEIISEETINNLDQVLLKLHEQGKVKIFYYPERPQYIPADDEDLLKRGVIWSRLYGDKILAQIKKYHPNLLPRVEEGINRGDYQNH
jgi:hypothetical protein